MITKSQVKHIQSLADKKCRIESGQFAIEGEKLVLEVLSSAFTIEAIFASPDWLETHKNHPRINDIACHAVAPADMARISFLKTPSPVLALVGLPTPSHLKSPKHAILLDTIQDPGNLGTIIRIADWYGISTIYLFGACADPWQPKCIQSTMGSFLRVNFIPLTTLNEVKDLPFTKRFAATLNGLPPNNEFIHQPGLLMIGNESKGLDTQLQAMCTHPITLPRVGGAESLNAAVATGILCHVWIC